MQSDLKLTIEEISNDDEAFVSFLDYWSEDIEHHFPDFSIYDTTFASVFLLKINNESAGLFIYQDKGEELHIDLDYLIPKYRDRGIGKKFFEEKLDTFKKMGFEIIISVSDSPKHQKYLESLGFVRSSHHHFRYELVV